MLNGHPSVPAWVKALQTVVSKWHPSVPTRCHIAWLQPSVHSDESKEHVLGLQLNRVFSSELLAAGVSCVLCTIWELCASHHCDNYKWASERSFQKVLCQFKMFCFLSFSIYIVFWTCYRFLVYTQPFPLHVNPGPPFLFLCRCLLLLPDVTLLSLSL